MSAPSRWLRRLLRPLWLLLAIIFVFEGWLWDRLATVGLRIANLIALPALKARLAAAITRLPPAAALVVFVVPLLVLLPIKVLGLWMLARGSFLGALGLLAVAKVVSVGTTAFLFRLARPRLLQLGWFRLIYEWLVKGLDWAHRQIDPIKLRLRAWARALIDRHLQRRPNSRWLRLLRRLRRRAQRA